MTGSTRLITSLAVAGLVLALDQLSKAWLVDLMIARNYQALEITSFFNIVMVWNTGVSFGMFSGESEVGRWVLVVFNLLVSLVIVVWMIRKDENRVTTLGLALVLGGALGNIADRIFRGSVADFFDFHVAGWHFWAFNIADSAIAVGIAILLWDSFFGVTKNNQGAAPSAKR